MLLIYFNICQNNYISFTSTIYIYIYMKVNNENKSDSIFKYMEYIFKYMCTHAKLNCLK